MAGLLAVKTDRRHLPETWAAFGHVTCDTMLSSEKFTFENHAIRLNNKKKISSCSKFRIACWVPFIDIFSWMCSVGHRLAPLARMLE